jgi:hypothetical protein
MPSGRQVFTFILKYSAESVAERLREDGISHATKPRGRFVKIRRLVVIASV